MDINRNIIKEWSSISEASKQFDNPDSARHRISDCCKGRIDSYGGYKWRNK